MKSWNDAEIIGFIKKDLLLERLELEETGLQLEDIADDELLLDEGGLSLDSVDALDLLVGIEKAFNYRIENIDKTFIEENCKSITTLLVFIKSRVLGEILPA